MDVGKAQVRLPPGPEGESCEGPMDVGKAQVVSNETLEFRRCEGPMDVGKAQVNYSVCCMLPVAKGLWMLARCR